MYFCLLYIATDWSFKQQEWKKMYFYKYIIFLILDLKCSIWDIKSNIMAQVLKSCLTNSYIYLTITPSKNISHVWMWAICASCFITALLSGIRNSSVSGSVIRHAVKISSYLLWQSCCWALQQHPGIFGSLFMGVSGQNNREFWFHHFSNVFFQNPTLLIAINTVIFFKWTLFQPVD